MVARDPLEVRFGQPDTGRGIGGTRVSRDTGEFLAPEPKPYTPDDETNVLQQLMRQYPNLTTPALESASQQILHTAWEFPEVLDVLAEDTAAGLAMTDDDVARRIADGVPRSELEPLIDAVVQEWMIQGAKDVFAVRQLERTETRRGKFNQETSPQPLEIQQRVLAESGLEVTGRLSAEAARPTVEAAGVYASGLAGSPGEWASNGDLLAMKVSPVDGEQMQMMVRLEDGTSVGSTAEAQFELVRALMGDAHEVVNRQNIPDDPKEFRKLFSRDTYDLMASAEKSRLGRGVLDGLWSNLQLLTDPRKLVTGVESIEERQSARDVGVKEYVDQLVAQGEVDEDLAVVAIADMLNQQQQELGVEQMGPGALIETAQSFFADNKDVINEEYRRSLDSEELVSEISDALGDEPISKQFIDEGLGRVLSLVQAWESVVQWIGVQTFDFMEDIGQGVWGVVSGDTDEGFSRFRKVVELSDEQTVGDYFGLEGGARDAVNLYASIGFDPLNVLFMGGKGAKAFTGELLTNPELAEQFVRTKAVSSMAKQIVRKEGPDAVRTVAAISSGLDSRSIRDLLRIGLSPADTVSVDQVNEILVRNLPSNGGTWMGESVGRASSRSTVEGFAGLMNKWPGLDETTKQRIIHVFGQMDASRQFDLAENTFLDDAIEWAVMLDGTTQRDLSDRIMEILDVWDTHVGFVDEAAGALREQEIVTSAQLAQARREASDWLVTTEGGGAFTVDDLPAVQDAVTNLRRMRDAPETVDEVIAQIDPVLDDLTGASMRLEQIQQQTLDLAKVAHKKISATERVRYGLEIPQTREGLIQYVYDWYTEIGDHLRLPVLEGVTNPFNGRHLHDWSLITGKGGKHLPETADDAAAWFGLAPQKVFKNGKEVPLIGPEGQNLKVLGFANRVGKIPLPASPMEIVAYMHNPAAVRAIQQSIVGRGVKTFSRGLKTVFAYNLLLNPVTAFKAHFDEVLRFMVDTGEIGKGVGALIPRKAAERARLLDEPTSWANQYSRNTRNFTAKHYDNWEIVTREGTGKRHYMDQVERFVNGTVLKDDVFQEYALSKLRGDPAVFYRWWDETGRANRRSGSIKFEGEKAIPVSEMTATDAYKVIDDGFELFLRELVDDPVRDQLRRRMIDAASAGGRLSRQTDGALLRGVRQIPGQSDPTKGWNYGFEMLFGAPAERRGGVFFDHYFDYAKNIHTKAKENKILTVEHLTKEGFDPIDAQHMLAKGRRDPVVRNLLDQRGWTTEAAIETAAARYAKRMADNLMYRLSATSIAGKTAEAGLLVPFLRAQTDFLGWWWKQMTRPVTVRMSPQMRQKFSESLVGRGALAGVEALEHVPLNLRLWSRYAHLISTMNDDEKSPIDEAIESLTFIPLRSSNEFLIDIVPHPGPIPSWILDASLSSESDTRQFLETVFPGLGFTAGDPTLSNLDEYVVPPNSRSWRGIIGHLQRYLFAEDPERALMPSFFDLERRPYVYNDMMSVEAGAWLKENILSFSPGDTEWSKSLREVDTSVLGEANRAEARQRAQRIAIPWTGPIPTGEAIENYAGIIEQAEVLNRIGVLLDEDMKDLLGEDGVWAKFQAGEADREEITFLWDKMASVLFERGDQQIMPGVTVRDWLVAKYPEMAVNTVSKAQCAQTASGAWANPEFCRSDGRLDIKEFGARAAEKRTEGFTKGWFEQRGALGEDGWIYEAQTTALGARWRIIKGVFRQVTDRDYGEIPKGQKNNRARIAAAGIDILNEMGVVGVSSGMSWDEFYEAVKQWEDTHLDFAGGGASYWRENPFVGNLKNLPAGRALMDNLEEGARWFSKEQNIDYVGDWPEDQKALVRERVQELIWQGAGMKSAPTVADYEKHWERFFGPLDWVFHGPPGLQSKEIEKTIKLGPGEFRDGTAEVLDGDTVSLVTNDGVQEVRIIGLNAPERGQEGSEVAAQMLRQVLMQADDVSFVVWRPEEFGVSQRVAPDGRERLLMWLFVDGVPLYDRRVFTSDNPRGALVSGEVVDLFELLEENR